jgi:hypothetical protein
MNIAEQIADLDARIADTETRIVQQQKHVENLLARGADTANAQSELAVLRERLTHLQSSRAYLEMRQTEGTPKGMRSPRSDQK